jgi:hypothetical protein
MANVPWNYCMPLIRGFVPYDGNNNLLPLFFSPTWRRAKPLNSDPQNEFKLFEISFNRSCGHLLWDCTFCIPCYHWGSEVFFKAATIFFSLIVMSLSANLISLTMPAFYFKFSALALATALLSLLTVAIMYDWTNVAVSFITEYDFFPVCS